jgi:hypothetical protein
MKISSLGITHHLADEIDRVLDLAVGIQLPLFDNDCHTNHVACSRYVKLQILVGFRGHQGGWSSQILLQIIEDLLCLLGPLELVLFLRSLKKGSPLTPSRKMHLLKAAKDPINFWTSRRLSGGFILVIANTFSVLGSIPHRETIYLTNFPEGTPNVHFLGFNFILNFLRMLKVSTRSEMSPSSS